VLALYSDAHGRLREVIARPGSGGSVLVIDRDATTQGDRRLVAHLAADEPRVNAAVACNDYLNHRRNHRCRRLTPADLWVAPFAEDHSHCPQDLDEIDAEVRDCHHHAYRLLPSVCGIAIPELRWHRLPKQGLPGDPQTLSLRDVIGALESYQPMRALSARAIARHGNDPRLSVAALRLELERLDGSPIVLNRGLREAVQRTIDTQGISLSEITVRCGRCKRDPRGGIQGDTSWLARRLGLRPEAGRLTPTPWVHSDVLGLIARQGLGVSPREVELG
jgi:hypothetical protein